MYIVHKNYLKALVICHGGSEKDICDVIKAELKLNIRIISRDNGGTSIQITSLYDELEKHKLDNYDDFIKEYGNLIDYENNKIINNFKIFIIMDTDDCTPEQKSEFINKNMFKDKNLRKYIVPIYNDKKLEDVFYKVKLIDIRKKTSKEIKREYKKLMTKWMQNEAKQKEFYEKLLKVKNISNMHEFIKFCLDNRPIHKKTNNK
ncbi:hypothetical protein [Brachyspira hyodysenteriae]|uniref:hypothetical protein n=1 Tax=Brachyspira hyodysenteriae TaxID=159 RepID=UPI0022CD7C55|nr:hypothetical protein [Brachyspira hyodysenteriae]MCZ9920364.1 hypothetical protein [Brachyspira hyodysenteriae]MCZ9965080.1 hypothetical protein [Brachyspira hyodysenteriae]MDA0158239.1 hypothetical protein [Brachyspira hyodysenteriae]